MDNWAEPGTFLKESVDPVIELSSLTVAGVTYGSQQPIPLKTDNKLEVDVATELGQAFREKSS